MLDRSDPRSSTSWPSRSVRDLVRRELLRHPIRREAVELVRERPGMNKSQLGSALSIQNTLLDFHLGKLTEVGLIVTRSSAQDREVLCFAAEDANLWDDERTRILYGRGQNRAVAMFLADHPGADTQEIAQALGMSCVTVRYHLRTLRDHTLVHKLQAGRRVLYAPDPVLEDWVARVGEPFDRPWHE